MGGNMGYSPARSALRELPLSIRFAIRAVSLVGDAQITQTGFFDMDRLAPRACLDCLAVTSAISQRMRELRDR